MKQRAVKSWSEPDYSREIPSARILKDIEDAHLVRILEDDLRRRLSHRSTLINKDEITLMEIYHILLTKRQSAKASVM